MPRSQPTRLVTPSHNGEGSHAELAHNAMPAQKDRLGEAFDLTEARVAKLTLAIWKSADAHDFVQLGVGAIHRRHHVTQRGEAIAALVGCSVSTGKRIAKSETQHSETWPLLLAGILPFLTLAGAAAFISAATGMDEDEALSLIRRHVGPETQK